MVVQENEEKKLTRKFSFFVLVNACTFQTERLIGQKGDLHEMGVLQKAVSGEIVHHLNFSRGFHFMLQPAYFGTVWARLPVSSL